MTIEIEPVATERSAASAVLRGAGLACPACGARGLFSAFLRVTEACRHCGEELHHHRADDAPPYFTILIVGHVVVAGALLLEQTAAPAQWLQFCIWIPATLALCLLLLPRIKGALVGLQWAYRMHGFGAGPDPAAPCPVPAPEGHEHPRAPAPALRS